MSIASCVTWECVNSFANWLAALGTIFISGLALWLSVRDRAINLKADFNTALLPKDDPKVLETHVFALSFTNQGPRTVTVNNFVLSLPFSKKVIYIFPWMDSRVSHFCSKLPAELLDGKTGHIFFPIDFFNSLEKPDIVLFHKNKLLAWMRIHFFRIYVVTTVGKRVVVSIKKLARKKQWSMYCG